MKRKVKQHVGRQAAAKAGDRHTASGAAPVLSGDKAANLLYLQRTRGNQFTQRLLSEIGNRCQAAQHELKQTHAPQIMREKGQGQTLDQDVRAFMESRLDGDFSQVRIHTDGHATQTSDRLNAVAYTVGNDVFFNKGQYHPRTDQGRRLLAHELTHVVQQQEGHAHSSQENPRNESRLEAEADNTALRLTQPKAGLTQPAITTNQATPSVQRKLKLTGKKTALDKTVKLMNAGLEITKTVSIDAGGNVDIKASGKKGKSNPETTIFTSGLESIVKDAGQVTIGVTEGGTPLVGSFSLAQIDIDDMNSLGTGERGWDARAAFLHEVTEQREKQVNKKGFGTPTTEAHGTATTAELGMIGAEFGNKGATLESDTPSFKPNADGTISGTRTTIIKYGDGTRWEMIVTVTSNNITKVDRKQLK